MKLPSRGTSTSGEASGSVMAGPFSDPSYECKLNVDVSEYEPIRVMSVSCCESVSQRTDPSNTHKIKGGFDGKDRCAVGLVQLFSPGTV